MIPQYDQPALGDKDGAALALPNLGEVAVVQGRFDEASHPFGEGLKLAYEVGSTRSIAYCLEGIARLNAAGGNIETAACIWGAATTRRERAAIPLPPAIQVTFERDLCDVPCQLGEETWAAAWERRRAMTTEGAVAQALEKERVG